MKHEVWRTKSNPDFPITLESYTIKVCTCGNEDEAEQVALAYWRVSKNQGLYQWFRVFREGKKALPLLNSSEQVCL